MLPFATRFRSSGLIEIYYFFCFILKKNSIFAFEIIAVSANGRHKSQSVSELLVAFRAFPLGWD